MAINFIAGDILRVRQTFVVDTLQKMAPTPFLSQLLATLGYFGVGPLLVKEVGSIGVPVGPNGLVVVKSYIKLAPISDSTNPTYLEGTGTNCYFDSDTLLNNSFEFSTAYLQPEIYGIQVKNTSGVPIPVGSLVSQTGYDTVTQLATASLATAVTAPLSVALGVSLEDIANGEIGSVLVQGSYQGLDTSLFSLNDLVYVSDTAGEISNVAGTNPSAIGRVLSVGVQGTIFLFGPSDGGGSGGGAQGVTGIQGSAGSTGIQGVQGNTGISAGGGTTYPVAPSGGVYTTSAGTNATAVGDNTTAAGTGSVSIGRSATSPGTNTVTVGISSTSINTHDVTIGPLNTTGTSGIGATAGESVSIGRGNLLNTGFSGAATPKRSIAIGYANIVTTSTASTSTAVGWNIGIGQTNWVGRGTAGNSDNICIGDNNQAGASADNNAFQFRSNIAIGLGCYAAQSFGVGTAGAHDNIAIGDGASALGLNDNICIGDFGQAGDQNSTHTDCISIGNSNIIYGNRCIGIGFGTSVTSGTPVDVILLGFGSADWGGVNSQSNCFISGSNSHPITSVWFGSGMNSGGAAPTAWALRGSENWGSSTNKNGGDLNIVAGRGYNGGTGGDLYLKSSNVAGVGVIGTEQNVGVFDHLGNARIGLATTTAASTNGFIYIPAGTGGPPVGVPSAFSGMVPMWYDTTNDRLYIYNGSWKTTTQFA